MPIMESILENKTAQTVIVFVIVVAAVFIYVIIHDKFNRKKALSGEDREALINVMTKAIPNAASYTIAYAVWEWTTWQGNRSTTKYWYYGIAFNRDELLVAPLSIDDGDIGYKDIFRVDKSNVYCVNAFLKGVSPWVELYDRDMKEIISLMVMEENLKDDRYHPVNILQPDEFKAFVEWAQSWMDDINVPNGLEVTGKTKKPLKKK